MGAHKLLISVSTDNCDGNQRFITWNGQTKPPLQHGRLLFRSHLQIVALRRGFDLHIMCGRHGKLTLAGATSLLAGSDRAYWKGYAAITIVPMLGWTPFYLCTSSRSSRSRWIETWYWRFSLHFKGLHLNLDLSTLVSSGLSVIDTAWRSSFSRENNRFEYVLMR